MIRNVLLVIYGAGWLVTVVTTAVRTGSVPGELWAGLGVGVGALLAVFKAEEGARPRPRRQHEEEDERP
jgi:hypothetical protein